MKRASFGTKNKPKQKKCEVLIERKLNVHRHTQFLIARQMIQYEATKAEPIKPEKKET